MMEEREVCARSLDTTWYSWLEVGTGGFGVGEGIASSVELTRLGLRSSSRSYLEYEAGGLDCGGRLLWGFASRRI